MSKEQDFLDAKVELEAMIALKKSQGEGLRNFDVWRLREKANKARNAWRAEQRKSLKLVDEKTLREQIAREIETELRCLCEELREIELQNFPESTSFPMCHRCIAAAIARGEK